MEIHRRSRVSEPRSIIRSENPPTSAMENVNYEYIIQMLGKVLNKQFMRAMKLPDFSFLLKKSGSIIHAVL